MTDVFLAFAAADADRVAPIAAALQSRGFNVYQSPAVADPSAEAVLASAKAVIIVWSTASTTGDWPGRAADSGKDREILLPIFLDAVAPRVGYGQFQGENLAAYPAAPADAGFERLVTKLEALRSKGKPAAAAAAAPLLSQQRPGAARYLVPAALLAAMLGGGYMVINRAPQPDASTPPAKEQTNAGLGAEERFGLSAEDLAALEPQALIAKALQQADFDSIEAGAAEDTLSGTLLCLAKYYGEGVEKDLAGARSVCAQASDAGSSLATYVLNLDARAAGDAAHADTFLKRAATAGDARAQHDLAVAVRATDARGARALAEKCAAQGLLACKHLMAEMQIAGEGGPKDQAAGVQALEALDAAFYAPAIVTLGKMYRDGVGVPRDLEEAGVRFQRAAVLGDGEANYILGQMSQTGEGMPKDPEAAAEFFGKASAAGYAPPASATKK